MSRLPLLTLVLLAGCASAPPDERILIADGFAPSQGRLDSSDFRAPVAVTGAPTDGQVLTYDSTTGTWRAEATGAVPESDTWASVLTRGATSGATDPQLTNGQRFVVDGGAGEDAAFLWESAGRVGLYTSSGPLVYTNLRDLLARRITSTFFNSDAGLLLDGFTAGGVYLNSDNVLRWNSTTTAAYASNDVGLARDSAGVVRVTDGGAGMGDLTAGKVVTANDGWVVIGGDTTDGVRIEDDGTRVVNFRRGGDSYASGVTVGIYSTLNVDNYVRLSGSSGTDGGAYLGSAGRYKWSSTTTHDGAVDLALARSAAGEVSVYTTDGGSTLGNLRASVVGLAAAEGGQIAFVASGVQTMSPLSAPRVITDDGHWMVVGGDTTSGVRLEDGGTRVLNLVRGGDGVASGVTLRVYSTVNIDNYARLNGAATGTGGLALGSDARVKWNSATDLNSGAVDVALSRTAAGALSVYTTETGTTLGSLTASTLTAGSSGTFTFFGDTSEKVSHPSTDVLGLESALSVSVIIGGNSQWHFHADDVSPNNDDTDDIGVSGSNRVRTIYVGTSIDIDGGSLVTDTTIGLKIGTSAAQKLAVYGASPVVQGAAVADATGGVVIDVEARAALNALLARVRAFGVIAP